MKRHTKIYCDFFDIGEQDRPLCEWENCLNQIVDVHHLDSRGSGGDPQGKKDHIENLMGLCRKHHDMANNVEFNEKLKACHSVVVSNWVKIYPHKIDFLRKNS